jgi:hypothetical protein
LRAMKSGNASSSTRVMLAWGRHRKCLCGVGSEERRGRRQGLRVCKGFGCARASGVRAAARLIVALLAAQCPFGGIHHVHDHADDQLVEGRVAALARLDEALDPLLILLDPRLGSVGLDVVESGIEGLVRVRVRVRIRVRVRS